MKERQIVNKHARFTPSEWEKVYGEVIDMSEGEFMRRAVLYVVSNKDALKKVRGT